MRDDVFRRAARQLMLDEQAPTLTITGVDLLAYADSLIARFSNPALKHRTWQIAMDGSQKLPQRMLDGIRVHLARDSRWPLLALGVAGWMRYVSGTDDAGQTIDVRDPLVDKILLQVAQSDEQQRVDRPAGAGGNIWPRPAAQRPVCRRDPRRLATAGDARRPRGRRPRAEFLTIFALMRTEFSSVRLRTSLFPLFSSG